MAQYSLKAIRINKGDTQEQAATGIGISTETLANYEKGITYPDVPVLKRILNYYNVEFDEIDFLCS